MNKQGFTTRQVHADRVLNKPADGTVHTATTNSVLYAFDDAQGIIDVFQGKVLGHVYSRSSSPSIASLQNILNELEGGVGAVCFATGMAAISGTLLSLLKAGDHIIQGTPGMPDWFIPLINRITTEGTDVTKKLATVEREIVHTKK